VALAFALVAMAPGDVIDQLPNSDAARPALEAAWGLDQPPLRRLGTWLSRAASGDLGRSWAVRPGAPVSELLAGPAIASVGRVLGAAALATLLAGAMAVLRVSERWSGWVSAAPTLVGVHVLVLALNEGAWALMGGGWIERPSWFALPDQASWLREALAVCVLAVGSGSLSEAHQELRAAADRTRHSPLADATRARGEPLWPLLLRHAAPTACSVAAARVAALWGGAVVVEKLLLLPGAGATLWDAANSRDLELVLGCVALAAGVVASTRLASDLGRWWLDPRLRSSP
jgi:peptide/nickel transport system permease protein